MAIVIQYIPSIVYENL